MMQLAVWSGQAELVKQHIEAGQQAVNIEEPWVGGIGSVFGLVLRTSMKANTL